MGSQTTFPINTARIPELNPFSTYGALSLLDRIPVWMNGYDKTVFAPLSEVQQLLILGGGSPYVPIVNGDQIIHTVTPAEAGGTIVSIPSLAGKTFKLRRSPGFAMKPIIQYEVLSAGGFELKATDDVLVEGEEFELELYQLSTTGGTPGATPGTGTGGLIAGIVPITTSSTLSTSDVNKVLQLRANSSTQLTLTLPAVQSVPHYSFVIIEAVINSTKQHKINVQSGQKIYMNSASNDQIYIGAGEVAWLYRDEDGWYVFNDFGKVYGALGRPYASYKVGLGEMLFDGSLQDRTEKARLWEEVQAYGSALVSETTWQSSENYRGCWSDGDGVNTFRAPDLMGMALRGVVSTSGTDPLRPYNNPGGFQDHMVGEHDHTIPARLDNPANGFVGKTIPSRQVEDFTNQVTATNIHTTGMTGGAETIMKNIGVLWVTKY